MVNRPDVDGFAERDTREIRKKNNTFCIGLRFSFAQDYE
jgi:hypothetical protein